MQYVVILNQVRLLWLKLQTLLFQSPLVQWRCVLLLTVSCLALFLFHFPFNLTLLVDRG